MQATIWERRLAPWKEGCADLQGAHKEAIVDFNRRYGLTRHAAWLTETPAGPAVIALQEGPGGDELMPKLAASHLHTTSRSSKLDALIWSAGV